MEWMLDIQWFINTIFFNVPPYIKILLSVICMHSYE